VKASDIQTDCSPIAPAARRNAAAIVTVVVTALISLTVFGAAGWNLRRLRVGAPGRPIAPSTPAPHEVHDSPSLSQGRLIYQVHCARCHGAEGRGDGSDAPLLKSRPRDLASPDGGKPLVPNQVRRAIASGVPRTSMTAFGQILSDRDIDRLVEVVLSFAGERIVGEQSPLIDPSILRHLERAAFIPEPRHRIAPVFTVQSSDQKVLSLDGLRGRLVLVIFWSTMCGPCLEELPTLERLADRFRDAGLSVLPVCVEEAKQGEAFAVASARTNRLPVYVNPDNSARLGYDIRALPAAVLIDRSGRLLGSAQGAKNWAGPEVEALIETCLAAPQPPG
jgi:mono/diheme cytochrome c family protein/peroxiredoxin